MYVVTDDTIAVTVTDNNRVTTHAITIVIVDSLDEQLMPKQNTMKFKSHTYKILTNK